MKIQVTATCTITEVESKIACSRQSQAAATWTGPRLMPGRCSDSLSIYDPQVTAISGSQGLGSSEQQRGPGQEVWPGSRACCFHVAHDLDHNSKRHCRLEICHAIEQPQAFSCRYPPPSFPNK